MRKLVTLLIAVAAGVAIAAVTAGSQGRGGRGAAGGPRPPALLQSYDAFSVTPPPPELALDPFYKKYTDAHGIPIATSDKVPDAALLMARDIVKFMLADRPGLRKELIRKKWKVAFPRDLQQAGYRTGFFGKWHMGNDASPRPGFTRWVAIEHKIDPSPETVECASSATPQPLPR
jgi:hypothetical protein